MIQLNETICGEHQKRRMLENRGDVDIIRMRAEAVYTGRRLAIMSLYFGRGATCREIGALIGRSEGQTWRIITDLVEKLSDSRCVTFIRNREKFTPEETALISTYLFEGLSLQKTAMKHKCTAHRVRSALGKLGGMPDTNQRKESLCR